MVIERAVIVILEGHTNSPTHLRNSKSDLALTSFQHRIVPEADPLNLQA